MMEKSESESEDQVLQEVEGVSPPPPAQKSPDDSKRLIQKQLVLLLHSHACLRKDVGHLPEDRPRCPIPNCEMMKEVWFHIKSCRTGPDCPHLHCSSSLKILAHWKHCQVWECPVCHLVRLKGAHQSALLAKKNEEAQRQHEQEAEAGDQKNPHHDHQNPHHISNGLSGQSTKLHQGLGHQCQGQQLLQHHHQQHQMMEPGSESNNQIYYHYNNKNANNGHSSSEHENTCHVPTVQEYHHHHQINQINHNHHHQQYRINEQNPLHQEQSLSMSHLQLQLEQEARNQFISQRLHHSYENSLKMNRNATPTTNTTTPPGTTYGYSHQHCSNIISNMMMVQNPDELMPSSTTAISTSNHFRTSDAYRRNVTKGYLNARNCQCAKCAGFGNNARGSNEPMVFLSSTQLNSMSIAAAAAAEQQNIFSRKRCAEDSLETLPCTRAKLEFNDGAPPSANDVRRAYEQLGIPCPSDALKRLMATLPGGCKGLEGSLQEVPQGQVQVPQNDEEEDDGINVDYNNLIHDECQASWCLSLVERFIANRNKQRELAGVGGNGGVS